MPTGRGNRSAESTAVDWSAFQLVIYRASLVLCCIMVLCDELYRQSWTQWGRCFWFRRDNRYFAQTPYRGREKELGGGLCGI
ncbi:MAG: hypothetical protein RL233_1957 [Bacteroidota bacterium]